MSQSFDSPRLLIERAQSQIDEFRKAISAFSASQPYNHTNAIDSVAMEQIFKVQLTKPLPAILPAILKDCLGNLRDALDHAVYGSAIDLGIIDPTKTAFPFGGSKGDVKRDLDKKYRDIPQSMKNFLLDFRPYPGGNELLVALNRLRNPTIHRIVVPVGMAHSDAIHISSGIISSGQLGYSKWHPSSNDSKYARIGAGARINHQVSFEFDANFENVEGLSGKAAAKTLNDMLAEVTGVVDAIAIETARLSAG